MSFIHAVVLHFSIMACLKFDITDNDDDESLRMLSDATKQIIIESYISESSTIHIAVNATTARSLMHQKDLVNGLLLPLKHLISYTTQDTAAMTNANVTFTRTHNLILVDGYSSFW